MAMLESSFIAEIASPLTILNGKRKITFYVDDFIYKFFLSIMNNFILLVPTVSI
jgi:hypothetical protein